MPVWLHVAEKPSVAKEVSQVLSNGHCRTTPSQSRYNPVFEFNFEGKTMLFTSVAGHLMEQEFPPHTRSWSSFPFADLFSAKITTTVKKDLLPVRRNIELLAKRADALVLWLDCDREGENICFEVIEVFASQNRRASIHRAHFSALTQRDLLHAIHNLKVPDKRLSDAVEARQEMDLRIGAVFTRFQTVRFRDAFEGMPSKVLSFGPCQFPTLGFVVRRHWEQSGFVPEDFFTLKLTHESTAFHCRRGQIYDQITATVIYDDMLSAAAAEGNTARVLSVRQRPTRRRPPVPLATVVLQKLASSHLRISSERCMTLAESLYQEGFLSYPRTETDSYTFHDNELLDLAKLQSDNAEVRDFVAAMLNDPQHRFRTPLRGGHDDKAHPPIHPTKARPPSTDEKGQLYTLVVRHFLACMSPDAVAATTSVVAAFGGELFTTSGTSIIDRGWLDVFPYERWNSSCIPNYAVDETFTPTEVWLDKGVTAPPPNLTETNLIALMDENGIGTDATIAQHIKTVLDREYVRRDGQFLVATKLGIALAAAYEALGLASLLQPQLRAQMEMAMSDITSGQATKEQVVEAAVKLYREIFERLSSSTAQFRQILAQYFRASDGSGDGAAETSGGGALLNPSAPSRVVKANFSLCGHCRGATRLIEVKDGEREAWAVECAACARRLRVPNGRLNELEALSPPHNCPLCQYTVLRVANREKQTPYTVCPYCFTNPPEQSLVDGGGDIENVGEFRCFQCFADCPLAKGKSTITIMPCASCGAGELRLRQNPSTGFFLSCKSYPHCQFLVTLPKASQVTPNPTQRCPSCHAVMLTFDFRGVQGVPGLDLVDTVCVSCDARLKDYLSVKGFQGHGSAGGVQRHDGRGRAGTTEAYSLPSVLPDVADRHRGGRGSRGGGRGGRGGRGGGAGASTDPTVLCGCGQPAKQLVSRKEASSGKRFLTCASRQCSFFQWLD